MLNLLLTILLSLVGVVLGFYLLLLGRRALWATAAIICLSGTLALLAIIFLRDNSGWTLVEERQWILLAVAVGAAVIGGVLGARVKPAAVVIVGFAAGGTIALWFYKISYYIVVVVGQMSEQTAFWVGIIILIVGGLVGLFFMRRYEAAALILISVAVGTELVVGALGLSGTSSFTAVVSLSLALLGLVVQYAQYLREMKAERPSLIAETEVPVTEFFDLSHDH